VNKPQLLVVAGCNGSGKSTYSKSLVPNDTIPFDYDKHFLDIYNAMFDSELRDLIAHNKAFKILEKSIENSFKNKLDFVTKQILIQHQCIGLKNLEVMVMKSI